MGYFTAAELRAAAARLFVRRRGAHRSARRRAATATPCADANMAAPPTPEADMATVPEPFELAIDADAMDREALREALRARGVEFSGRLGRKSLAALLKEHLDGGLGA